MASDFIKPEEVLSRVEIQADAVVADFGCGAGGFTLPLASHAKNGLVYALDIQEPVLNSLKGLANTQKIHNIKFIKCNLERYKGSTLPDESADLVVIANVLVQAESKNAVISEAKRVLKGGGQMLIVDWQKNGSQQLIKNPPSPEEIKRLASGLKFSLEKEFKAGNYHFALVFKK